jgi:tetratricopeptide (TPR) repeat protein
MEPSIAFQAGAELEAAGDESRAIEFYRQTLEINPKFPWATCRLGLLQQRRGDIEAAFESFHRSLDIFGNPPEDPLGMQCAEALVELDPTFAIAN